MWDMLPRKLPRLPSERVVLRAFEERDAGLVQSVASDPLIPLITSVPATGALADAVAYIHRQNQRLVDGTGYSFAIADAVTDEAVGQIGLWVKDIAEGRATTGYWVAPQFRCRRYAGAALQTLTDWALAQDEVARLQLYVEPWNEASWRAAESSGYVREGLLRSWERVGPERRDMYMYSALRP